MSEDYWEKKYREKEREEQVHGQIGGCFALILAFGGLALISLL